MVHEVDLYRLARMYGSRSEVVRSALREFFSRNTLTAEERAKAERLLEDEAVKRSPGARAVRGHANAVDRGREKRRGRR